MVHTLHKKILGGNVMLKIDMAKAYDQVDWSFLLEVLKSFDFSNIFYNLIGECIKSPWFYVTMNGTFKDFFQSAQGLQQGDPLSPYLFIIMEEVLTRLLRNFFENGRIDRFTHPVGVPLVCHLLYTDDLLIFSNGGQKYIKRLVEILTTYERWSSQKISREKSVIFPSKLINLTQKRELLRVTCFKEGHFHVIYLGAPLVTGRLTSRIIDPLVEKIRKKVAGWKFQLLSQGGRLILLQHVLSSLPLHIILVINVPKVILDQINFILVNFLWGEVDGKRKLHWRAWSKIFKSTNEGGLGLRDLHKAWNVDLLNELVGEAITKEIVQTKIPRHNGLDIYVWKPSLDGRFTTAIAWDATREKGDQLPWHKWFWNKSLPKKVSMCNWRAWFQSLATYERVQNKGISLASVCDCCVLKEKGEH
ncbi:hypothetical protein Ddye_017236 [Dipteronia dyeriana]|uniref:Reverse transcriptase domain-containing protein n=1 Tax=Dipteronia dyeriana TaxID=168575 RepID=A0AAD9U8B9_9ROSI|nr:hypothetical protein Ddye_017236 [Dipteronia dyeriana]